MLDNKKLEILREIVKSGKNKDEAKRELISQGHSDEDFSDLWDKVQSELVAETTTAMFNEPKDEVKEETKAEPKVAVTDETEANEVATNEVAVSDGEDKLIGVFPLIGGAFKMAKSRLSLTFGVLVTSLTLFLIISLLLFVSFGFSPLFLLIIQPGIYQILSTLVSIIIGIVHTALILFVIARLLLKSDDGGKPIKYIDSFMWAVKNILPIGVILLFLQLAIFTGFLVLIIPALVIGVYTLFSAYVFICEDRRGLTALIRSTDLVRGKWWAVFGRGVVSVILSILVGILILLILLVLLRIGSTLPDIVWTICLIFILALFALGGSFTVVWVTAGLVMLYESLAKRKPADTFKPDSYKTLRVIYIVLIVIGGLLLIANVNFSDPIIDGELTDKEILDQIFNSYQSGPNSDTATYDDMIPREEEVSDFYDSETLSGGVADTDPAFEDSFPTESFEDLPQTESSDNNFTEPPSDF